MFKTTRIRLLCCAGALALLTGCASTVREAAEPTLTGQSKLRLATAAEDSGNRDLAASMFAAAAASAPDRSDVQLTAAEGLARNGKLQEAEMLLGQRLKAAPGDLELRRALGGVQILTGHPEQAVESFSRVLAAKRDDVKALANKGVALDMLGQHEAAQALYGQALTLVPNDPAISNDLALSLMQSGRLNEARRTLEPFRNMGGLPERMGINLGLMDAASGEADLAQPVLSRMKSEDLTALTQAMRQGGTSPTRLP